MIVIHRQITKGKTLLQKQGGKRRTAKIKTVL